MDKYKTVLVVTELIMPHMIKHIVIAGEHKQEVVKYTQARLYILVKIVSVVDIVPNYAPIVLIIHYIQFLLQKLISYSRIFRYNHL